MKKGWEGRSSVLLLTKHWTPRRPPVIIKDEREDDISIKKTIIIRECRPITRHKFHYYEGKHRGGVKVKKLERKKKNSKKDLYVRLVDQRKRGEE